MIISFGLISFSSRYITLSPAVLASLLRPAYTAGIVPLNGRPIPIASVRQFIELAVYIPEQEPQVGQQLSSYSASSFSVILPLAQAPTYSNISDRPYLTPSFSPGSIGPPLTKTDGRFILQAAISIPGTILSQLGINTTASSG